MPRYHAAWVSGERGGDESHPNVLTYHASGDPAGLALAHALDASVSGDLMSVTVDIAGSLNRDTYPTGTGAFESGLLIAETEVAGESVISASEHFKFFDLAPGGSARSYIDAYVKAAGTKGKLLMFRSGIAVTGTVGARH